MRRERLMRGAVGVVAVLASAVASGAGLDPRTVSMPWTVVVQDAPAEVLVAKKGDVVLKQRLLPFGYATLAADAVDAKTGNLVAAAGTALLQLKAETGRAYCVAATPRTTALPRARPGSPYLRACFLDADADGRFDSSTEYDGGGVGLPSVSGKLPKHMHALTAPVAYQVRPADEYAPAMYVGIKFDGFAALGGTPMFVDAYGPEVQGAGITRAWPRGEDGTGLLADTGEVLILGAKLGVIGKDGGAVRVRVDRAMPAGQIGIWLGRSSFF